MKNHKEYRLPSGNYTSNLNYYIKAWKKVASPICKATGWKIVAFNPDFQFLSIEDGNQKTVSMPLWAVKHINNSIKR